MDEIQPTTQNIFTTASVKMDSRAKSRYEPGGMMASTKGNQTTTAGRSSLSTFKASKKVNYDQFANSTQQKSRIKSAIIGSKKQMKLTFSNNRNDEELALKPQSSEFVNRITGSSLKSNNYFATNNVDNHCDHQNNAYNTASSNFLTTSRKIGERLHPEMSP